MFRCFVFFFKQKTAYEMRISDWSSDVCSSDLGGRNPLRCGGRQCGPEVGRHCADRTVPERSRRTRSRGGRYRQGSPGRAGKRLRRNRVVARESQARDGGGRTGSRADRKTGGEGKSVVGRVDVGGGRGKKKKTE